jgi:hypothetical protein
MNLPETASLALKVPKEALGKELVFAAAVKLYELGGSLRARRQNLPTYPSPFLLPSSLIMASAPST